MTKMKLAIVLCGCLISGVAAAAPAKWDANGDGTLDRTEKTLRHDAMKAKRIEAKQKLMLAFDANKDGKLDKTERIVIKGELATRAFKRLDTDGNGVLSFEEFKQGKRFGKHLGRQMRRGHLKVR